MSAIQPFIQFVGGRALKASAKMGVGGKIAGRVGARVVGDAAKKAAGALGSIIGASSKLLGAAAQPSEKPRKQTISPSLGMVGKAGKSGVSGGGTMPSAKRVVERVSGNESSHELLKIAVNYLSSIDATLKAQLDQQRYFARIASLNEREKAMEESSAVDKPSGSLFQKMTQSSTFNSLMKMALLSVAAIAYNNLDQIDDLAREVFTFAEQASGALSGAITAVGGVAAGLGIAGVVSAIMKGGFSAAKTLFRSSALGVGVSFGLDVILSLLKGEKIDGATIARFLGGAAVSFLAGVGGSMVAGPVGAVIAGGAGYSVGADAGEWLYRKITGTPPSATPPAITTPNPSATPPSDAPDTAYDIVLGYGDYGRTEDYFNGRKLTQLTVAEAIEFGRNVLQPNSKADGVGRLPSGELVGDSGMGAYATNRTTIQTAVNNGIITMDQLYDRAAQDKVARWLYNYSQKQGNLHNTWAYFGKTGQRTSPMTFEEAAPYIMAGEGTSGRTNNRTPSAAVRAQTYTRAAIEKMKSVISSIKPTRVYSKAMDFEPAHSLTHQQVLESALSHEKLMRMRARAAEIVPFRRSVVKRATQRNTSAVMSVPNPNYGNTQMIDYVVYFGVS